MLERIIKYIRHYISDLAVDVHKAEELATLLNAKEVAFAKGEVIFPFRSDGRSCVFLEQGLVREYYLFDDKEVNLRLLCSGGVVLAYSAYLKRQPSEYCIEAVDDVRGISFSMPVASDVISNIKNNKTLNDKFDLSLFSFDADLNIFRQNTSIYTAVVYILHIISNNSKKPYL